jgi:NAD+ synthase (glutamine-hydrolysing)
MKITVCQLNYIVGDISGNTQKIIEAIEKAKKEQSDMVVFSELSVCGYPPYDLLFNSSFISDSITAIEKIASCCTDITAVVGGIDVNKGTGKHLYNTAFILSQGMVKAVYHKSLLPTYDVFDEARYFEPSYKPLMIEVNGKRIFITICEDLWTNETDTQPALGKPHYNYDTIAEIKLLKPDFVINIAASPFSAFQYNYRYNLLLSIHQKLECPLLYVNQVGANTELVFDGGSAFYKDNTRYFQLPFFEEKEMEINTEQIVANVTAMSGIQALNQALVTGIKDYFAKNGFTKAVLGLSGGIDSAVVALLAKQALGEENVHTLLMPSRFSSEHSLTDAIELCKRNHISYDILSIEKPFQSLESGLREIFKNQPPDIAEENIQARIRAVFLMAYSNKFGPILLNTSNKSEMSVGYGTLYGDMAGAISVLGDVYKTQVYQLAHFLNKNEELIPINIIRKPPSAELRPNQKDSDSLPEYDILDKILYHIIEEQLSISDMVAKGFDDLTVQKVFKLVHTNEYKRYQAPPVIRVSTKAFGYGRRIPLVKK